MVKDEVEIDSMSPQAPVSRPEVKVVQFLPRISQDESPGVDGLQVAPGHLQDQGHVRWDDCDDPRAPLDPTDGLAPFLEGIFPKWLESCGLVRVMSCCH